MPKNHGTTTSHFPSIFHILLSLNPPHPPNLAASNPPSLFFLTPEQLQRSAYKWQSDPFPRYWESIKLSNPLSQVPPQQTESCHLSPISPPVSRIGQLHPHVQLSVMPWNRHVATLTIFGDNSDHFTQICFELL